jgi:transposase
MPRLEIANKEMIIARIRSYFEHNDEAKYIHRLHGVLLFISKPEESCDSIGTLFGNSPRSISNWIKKVNATGSLESLRSTPPSGRPPRLSAEQKAEIKAVLQESPEQHGIAGNLWDGKSLSAYIAERYGITLKTRSCQNLFHKLGFSLKRARPRVARGDEEQKEKAKKNSGKK